MNLMGKSAIVTGAASGIGKGIAELLASQGVSVAIADVNLDAAQNVASAIGSAGGKAMGVAMDVTNEEAVNGATDRVARAFGGVDILVSNAGIQIVNPIESYSFADWKKMLAIHVDGAFLTTKAALKYMYPGNRGGTVIYMGSVHSHEVCPGFVRTPLVDKQIPEQARELGISEEEVVRRVMLGGTVDGIFTTVEDVAQTVLFLCAFPSAALTGQSFVVSHGWFMQ